VLSLGHKFYLFDIEYVVIDLPTLGPWDAGSIGSELTTVLNPEGVK
jgi:hypothetical protein